MAYVHALAGIAGLNLGPRTVFDYGIDGTFWTVKKVGRSLVQHGFPVNFQMKATTRWHHDESVVVYDLDARAHRILTDREVGEPMAILILLCLPENDAFWLGSCEDNLHLKHCCYWFRPPGPPTTNTSSVTIRIPRSNVLTPDVLNAIMRTARDEARAGQ